MNDGALVLDLTREGRRLKVGFSEDHQKTLRPYEDHEVHWEQVEKTCLEIISLLGRSNRAAPEIPNGLKKSGQLLFDLLIPAKAKEKLATTAAQTLTLRLEDSLVHIPWELLHDGREFLCRRFAIGRIPSTRQIPTSRSVRTLQAPFEILILADPRGDLEASYREGLEIKNFLDERRDIFQVDFKSYPVDIAFVTKNLRDYDIVHYAGHAEHDPRNPFESGWLLSDGILRAGTIAAMGGFQPMPALVFSNACQSGRTEEWMILEGYEQQIFGLANAFLLSGVQHYIGTFWEVVDEPSSHFAKNFYARLAERESVGTALHSARRHAYGERSLLWASYMLYGDPGFAFAGSEKKTNPILEKMRRSAQPGGARSAIYASAAAVLLLAAIYAGYSLFYPGAAKDRAAQTTMPNGSNASPEITIPLSLSMNIIGQRKEADGRYTEVIVREGSVLQSRDNFQVHVESNRHSFIYVLLFDSEGRASQLFPDPKIEQPGFVDGGRKVAVPDKDLWFWLDENPGTETVYVLASEAPMSDMRGLLDKMSEASASEQKRLSGEIKEQIKIVERGVGGIAKGKTVSYPLSDGSMIQKVTDVVAGSGAVVRAISFEHR
jgi:CHAT domain-containing protein